MLNGMSRTLFRLSYNLLGRLFNGREQHDRSGMSCVSQIVNGVLAPSPIRNARPGLAVAWLRMRFCRLKCVRLLRGDQNAALLPLQCHPPDLWNTKQSDMKLNHCFIFIETKTSFSYRHVSFISHKNYCRAYDKSNACTWCMCTKFVSRLE
jgi:hypothetical protein